MSDLRMKGIVRAPVYCRMPGRHQAAVKIVSVYDGIETSLYLDGPDIACIYDAYNRGQLPQVEKPAAKPRRRHV